MRRPCLSLLAVLALAWPGSAVAETRTEAALAYLRDAAARLPDPHVRAQTQEAFGPAPCVRHRAGLTAAEQAQILDALRGAGHIPRPADAREAEVQRRGVFPPVAGDDPTCPRLLQPLAGAPGAGAGAHHGWPGGLVDHEAFNLRLGLGLADLYEAQSGVDVDRDALSAAILWHDWAKALVFPWAEDGTLPGEYPIAGAGAHHVLGLAEALARDLPATVVLIQACAHTAPTGDDAAKVRGWLAAAALIARRPAPAPVAPTRECLISHASDDNWVHAEVAARTADAVLARLAARFGFDAGDGPAYRTRFRNPALAALGAERIKALWETEGDDGVARAVRTALEP